MSASETILYGYHPVVEAIRAGRRQIHRIYAVQEKTSPRREEILNLAGRLCIPVESMQPDMLAKLAGDRHHQGIAASVSPYPFSSLEHIMATAPQAAGAPFVVVLDQILDPHNLGAMARTALCAGAVGLVIPKDRAAQPSAACSKVSAGAIEHIAIASVTNLTTALKQLKNGGYWIAGAEREGQIDLFEADLSGPLAIVIGGEEKGLRPLVKKQCDYTLAIPQKGVLGSLNASVSAGIIMYEVFRQRLNVSSRK
jgi:23S rRNA (guanosine2251-2'-O)-methyltransferase